MDEQGLMVRMYMSSIYCGCPEGWSEVLQGLFFVVPTQTA